MGYYSLIPLLFVGLLAISMVKDYIQISYFNNINENKKKYTPLEKEEKED